jgi:hypothetical protein
MSRWLAIRASAGTSRRVGIKVKLNFISGPQGIALVWFTAAPERLFFSIPGRGRFYQGAPSTPLETPDPARGAA